jgi:hypothetical protein
MAKTGADGERYNPRGWVTRENNLIIKKASAPPRRAISTTRGRRCRLPSATSPGLLDESDLACAVFERLAGG